MQGYIRTDGKQPYNSTKRNALFRNDKAHLYL
jgi:hypothetical protein